MADPPKPPSDSGESLSPDENDRSWITGRRRKITMLRVPPDEPPADSPELPTKKPDPADQKLPFDSGTKVPPMGPDDKKPLRHPVDEYEKEVLARAEKIRTSYDAVNQPETVVSNPDSWAHLVSASQRRQWEEEQARQAAVNQRRDYRFKR